MRVPNNNDVPIETTLRHALIEKGKLESEIEFLKSEIRRLEDEISRKDKAIRDFKDWQRMVAEYNYSYWLTKGIELAGNIPDKELVNAVRRSLEKRRQFAKVLDTLDQLERKYSSMVATANNVKEITKNSDNLNNC